MRRDLTLIALLAALAVAWLALRASAPVPDPSPLDTTALLADAPEAFRRVTGPRPLEFPADHAEHPGYRSEWWYFTGNLSDERGRRFGMQFTLFRFGLAPDGNGSGDGLGKQPADPASDRPELDSVFAADSVWMAHLAVSDVAGQRFLHRERFARGALDLAGATQDRWWLRDWSVERTATGWRLLADAGDFALDLTLDPVKPVVLQGDRGYSQKGPAPGNASRYYTFPRLAADGTLRLDGREHALAGTAWLDREWGSSQLGPGIEGWDWFALQLDDGRDLMLYRLRTARGGASPFSAGALVQVDGQARILGRDDFDLEAIRRWRDPEGVEWPVAWRARVPSAGLDLAIRPTFDEQQWRTGVRYWEGAIDVLEHGSDDLGSDSRGSESRVGLGYLELSGYSAQPARGRR